MNLLLLLLQGENEIPDYEIHEIAKEIEELGKLAELHDELEEEGADLDAKTLLTRWQKEMISMDIPSRPRLLYHLSRIGIKNLHSKLVFFLHCASLLVTGYYFRLLFKEFSLDKYQRELLTLMQENQHLKLQLR